MNQPGSEGKQWQTTTARVEAQWDSIAEYERLVEKYGEKRAVRVAEAMYRNYTQVVLIDTGNYRMEEYRDFARAMADFLDLD